EEPILLDLFGANDLTLRGHGDVLPLPDQVRNVADGRGGPRGRERDEGHQEERRKTGPHDHSLRGSTLNHRSGLYSSRCCRPSYSSRRSLVPSPPSTAAPYNQIAGPQARRRRRGAGAADGRETAHSTVEKRY